MAAASYTTDLTTLQDAQSGTWLKTTATGWTAGPNSFAANDTDAFVQGTAALSSSMKTGVGAVLTPALGNFTIPTDGAILLWMKYDTPNSLNDETNGGIRLVLGNSGTVFYGWKHGGNDTYIYGGWQCFAVGDPASVSPDYTAGAPASPWQRVGLGVNAVAVPSKGNPFWIDAIRVGRCESRFVGGTAPDAACTFVGFAAKNDANDAVNGYNRWGLFQTIAGGYLWQGLMVFGYGAACRFDDANASINIANTRKVTANFNTIEVRNASSVITLAAVSFSALGTVSRGRWVTTDNATVTLDGCTFTDMDTFGFLSNTAAQGCIFRRCNTITAAGAEISGCTIDASRGASALLWDIASDPSAKLSGTSFVSSGTGNGLELGANCPAAIGLNCAFRGYSGTGANAAIYNHSGKTIDITWDGSNYEGGFPSVRGDPVNFLTGQATFSFTVTDQAGTPLTGYEWRLYVDDATPGVLGTEELAGEETAISDEQSYPYTYAGDIDVVLQVLHDDYLEFIWSGTLTASDQSIGVILTPEENV